MTQPPTPPTWVVLLTPPGQSALATVRVEGPLALAAVAARVKAVSGRPLAEYPPQRPAFGHFFLREGDGAGEEVVVRVCSARAVEIHCHGGLAVVEMIRRALVEAGCAATDWAAWSARQAADAIQAEALSALAEARTTRAAAILLDQYHGALGTALDEIDACARRGDWPEVARRCDQLRRRAALGLHMANPWQVVLAGPPNAGKSSLLNALVGYRRAIVDPQAGTTRDIVTAATAIDGWPVELADTAGLRDAAHALEQAGIDLARQRIARADLVVLVFDASIEPSPEETALRAEYPHALVALAKCDRTSAAGRARDNISTSAVTGDGLDALLGAIAGRLVPETPPPGSAVPFTPRQGAILESLTAAIACRNAGDCAACVAAMLAMPSPGA